MARTCLLYGESGSTKTSNLGQLVEYLYSRYGVPVRGIFGDNRGPVQTQVNSGKLIPWDITSHPDPLGCIIAAGMGYFPTKLEDGIAVGDLKLTQPHEWQNVSGYIIEGLTEIGHLIMRDREQKGISSGEPLQGHENPPELLTGSNLKLTFLGASRGTYGQAQSQTHRYVKNGFAKLPVPWAFFSAHQKKAFDKHGNPVYGPVIVGKALIADIPQWFDTTIHMDKYFYDVGVKAAKGRVTTVTRQGARAYFTSHKDSQVPTVIWPAKLGVPPELMADIFTHWPAGYVPLVLEGEKYVSSVATLLQLIEEHSDEQIAHLYDVSVSEKEG